MPQVHHQRNDDNNNNNDQQQQQQQRPPVLLIPPEILEKLQAGAFRALCHHLQERSDQVQNIDLMNLSGFCRNCLAKWMVLEARKLVDDGTVTDPITVQALNLTGYDETARYVYGGMDYGDWKKRHQQKATNEQMQLYESNKSLHAVHDKALLAKRSTTTTTTTMTTTTTNTPLLSNVCCQNIDDSNNKVTNQMPQIASIFQSPPQLPTNLPVPLKVAVLTISDRASAGMYQDLSGPAVVQAVQAIYDDSKRMEITPVVIVPDQVEAIQSQLKSWTAKGGISDHHHHHIILTTGGTGWSPQDVTPEATREILDQECSGLMAFVTAECSRLHQPLSSLSRGTAGVIGGKTLIANLPGNPVGVKEMIPILFPILLHAVGDLEQSSM